MSNFLKIWVNTKVERAGIMEFSFSLVRNNITQFSDEFKEALDKRTIDFRLANITYRCKVRDVFQIGEDIINVRTDKMLKM